MDKKLNDILNGKEDNYLYPFYWQHGNNTENIPQEIERIYRSGCHAFCVESRPHPDFCGEGWWRDMDIILKEAKARNMKVWVLDDDKCPTGHAAGAVVSHPQLRQRLLSEIHLDVVGPMKGASIIYEKPDPEDILIGAYAYRRNADEAESCSYQYVDLTNKISNGYLNWDIPEGVFRVFFYFSTFLGGKAEFIDMINPESVRLLIDSVYEPHYARYKDYFGNTLTGFFSDEPCFGNQVIDPNKQRFDFGYYQEKIGKPALALPWNDEVLKRMTNMLGESPISHLNLLWYSDDTNGNDSAEIRFSYMDAITKLYSECFTSQLADWCHKHGVIYTGHIIEDMNCHLGGGAGHYFRALSTQDISGIDVVLHQVLPGLESYIHTTTCATNTGDGAFYHYVLAKLGASLSHQSPLMKGRAMCEMFGAYGYGEDSTIMKYIVDHLLVRGINYFVPHAFTTHFPDPDCPPHFGVDDVDPSFEAFGALMRYTNKVAHILSDTVHKANAAVLYQMEGEWSSRFDNAMMLEPIVKRLYDAHIDYDITPMDILKQAQVIDGKLKIARESFDCLIVPYCDHLSHELDTVLNNLQESGLPVWFIDNAPENCSFDAIITPLDILTSKMIAYGFKDVTVEDSFPLLRIYHCQRGKSDIFMFFNEDYVKTANTRVNLPVKGDYNKLDIMTEKYFSGFSHDGSLHINLLPNQSAIYIFGDCAEFPKEDKPEWEQILTPSYKLSLADYRSLSHFEDYGYFNEFFNITSSEIKPDFAGKMRYTFDFYVKKDGRITYLDLGYVGRMQLCS